jgi:long-chain acyl-CoA synthetase
MNQIGFRYFAQLEPDTTAIVDQHGRTATRAQLFGASNALARALQARGLSRGDTIAVMAPNCIEYLQLYLAATQIGLYFVSINWHLQQSEIAYILADSGAKAFAVHEKVTPLARQVLAAAASRPQTLLCIGGVPEFTNIGQFAAGHSTAALEAPISGRMLTYTSATTGRPKGIDLPLQDAAAALERIVRVHMGLGILPGNGNVHLCASMLYHAAPLEWSAIALHMGHLLVLVERWEPELLLRLIDTHRVTTSFMVPAMFVRMLKLSADVRARYSASSLIFVGHSAAPCPPEIKRQMIEWWGPVIWESYGSSEGGGTVVGSRDWLKYPGTVGRPMPGSKIKVLDEDGNECPAGIAGTIYMTRYTGDDFQYRGDIEKSRAAHRGEFFTVGDIGYLNEEGYLFLCDRKIDMIIAGGLNIYPAEIEQVLIQHPQVLDCAVFGIPDELMGEAVKAVVQLQPGSDPSPKRTLELLDFLAARLAPAKLPRRIEYAAELPRDPNGKIFKRLLRDPHWTGRSRMI